MERCAYCSQDTAGSHRIGCPHNPDSIDPEKKEPLIGWICPACGRGNSPWNMTCPCVDQSIFYTYTGSVAHKQLMSDIEWAKWAKV